MVGVRTALIVGAGIGGLTTAIALRRAGVNVAVLERRLAPVAGAGDDAFTLWHNPLRTLRVLELDQRTIATGSEIHFHEYRSDRGRRLARWAIDPHTSRLHAPAVVLKRSALVAALTEALGEERVVRGAECVGVEHDTRSAAAVLADGSRHRADVLIGADGIDSTVRRSMRHGYDRPRRYAPHTTWRAFTDLPGEDVAPSGTYFDIWGRNGLRFRYCRVRSGEVFWEAITSDEVAGAFDMVRLDKRGALSLAYERWPSPVPQIIAATPERAISPNPMHRPSGSPQIWGSRRVALVGDAAHPQNIDLNQSATQAIEDGVLLGQLLTAGLELSEALVEYDRLRKPRVEALNRTARRIGQLGRIRGQLACAARDVFMRVLFDGWAQSSVYRVMTAEVNT